MNIKVFIKKFTGGIATYLREVMGKCGGIFARTQCQRAKRGVWAWFGIEDKDIDARERYG
jgi:hypothetical protein